MRFAYDQITYLFIENDMGKLPMCCHSVFFKIAYHSFGHMDETKLVTKKMICDGIGINERTVREALKTLEEKSIIIIGHGGGRGKRNGYKINMEYFSRNNLPGKINLENKGTVHGFQKPLELGQGSEQKPISTPAALPSASPPAVVLKKNNRKKRSKEETEMKDEIWLMFEDALGAKITGKSAALEAKSIWELIDMMNNGNGWKSDIKEMVSRFISYIKDPPEGFEYLRKCLPLPHILVSPRTWLKMTIKPPEEKKLPTLEETEKYMNDLIEEGFIHK